MGSDAEGRPMNGDRVAMIRAALAQLRVEDGPVSELRAPNVPRRYGRPGTVAGWFDDLDALAAAAVQLEERAAPGVYVTLNLVKSDLLARACNRLDEHPKATTSDADIVRRVWLPLDFDPVRPAGISATDDELAAAKARAIDAADWLTNELGDEPTIWACSGNGYHLLFRVDLPNTDESTVWVKHVIDITAEKFSDGAVSVDRTVSNAGRIWKVYGTLARKGDEVAKLGRIHRRARILNEGFQE
ncbi:MAG: hypothetical protein GY778_31825 [bacterium]|nr:hypothetical protein [bacterium]